jgi:hypothetical protein
MAIKAAGIKNSLAFKIYSENIIKTILNRR